MGFGRGFITHVRVEPKMGDAGHNQVSVQDSHTCLVHVYILWNNHSACCVYDTNGVLCLPHADVVYIAC